MAIFRKRSSSNNDPDELVAEAMQQLENENHTAAVTAVAAALDIDPEHGQAWYVKGIAHAELKQFDDAIEAYQESVKHAGERAALPLYNLGNLYQELGKFQRAAQCFQQATEADPTMADAWINLGRILDDSGQHAAAIELYDIALAIEPEDVMAWSNRGNSLRGLQQIEDALLSYRKALQLDSEDFAARIGVGACLVECGQTEEGLAALQQVLEETSHPLAIFEFATALAVTGQYHAAVTMFDVLVDNEFCSAEIWNNRGECLAKLDRVEESLESFDRSIEFDEQYSPAWFGKARVLANAERIDEAQPVAQRYYDLIDETSRQDPAIQALLQLCGIEV